MSREFARSSPVSMWAGSARNDTTAKATPKGNSASRNTGARTDLRRVPTASALLERDDALIALEVLRRGTFLDEGVDVDLGLRLFLRRHVVEVVGEDAEEVRVDRAHLERGDALIAVRVTGLKAVQDALVEAIVVRGDPARGGRHGHEGRDDCHQQVAGEDRARKHPGLLPTGPENRRSCDENAPSRATVRSVR